MSNVGYVTKENRRGMMEKKRGAKENDTLAGSKSGGKVKVR